MVNNLNKNEMDMYNYFLHNCKIKQKINLGMFSLFVLSLLITCVIRDIPELQNTYGFFILTTIF